MVDGLATRQDDAAMFVSEDAQDGMLLNEENSQASTITRLVFFSNLLLIMDEIRLNINREDHGALREVSKTKNKSH